MSAESAYYEYTDAREAEGTVYVTVTDAMDRVVARHIPWEDAYSRYGDVSWAEPKPVPTAILRLRGCPPVLGSGPVITANENEPR